MSDSWEINLLVIFLPIPIECPDTHIRNISFSLVEITPTDSFLYELPT